MSGPAIPATNPADLTGDQDVNNDDLIFFEDCMATPGGPSCSAFTRLGLGLSATWGYIRTLAFMSELTDGPSSGGGGGSGGGGSRRPRPGSQQHVNQVGRLIQNFANMQSRLRGLKLTHQMASDLIRVARETGFIVTEHFTRGRWGGRQLLVFRYMRNGVEQIWPAIEVMRGFWFPR